MFHRFRAQGSPKARCAQTSASALPPPNVELRFGLSATALGGTRGWWPGRRKRSDDTRQGKGSGERLFERVHGELKRENRIRMSPAKRMRRAEATAQHISGPVEDTLNKAARERSGVPEPLAQRHLLDALDACLDSLGDSLRLVLQDISAAPRRPAAVKLLLGAACRLMELVRRRQALRMLRFQHLEPDDWRTANLVFTAIAGLGAEATPMQGLLGPRATRNPDGSINVLHLYKEIQIIGLFDTCGWPLRYHPIVDAYARQVEQAMTVRFDLQPSAGSGLRFAHPYAAEPPRPSSIGERCIVLDITRLLAAVRTDWRHLDDVAAAAGWRPALANCPPATRYAVIRLLARDLGVADTDDPRPGPAPARGELHLQIGMDDLRNHLRSLFAGSGLVREQLQLFDAFSGSSARIGEGHGSADEAQWRITASAPQTLVAETKETRWTRPLRTGAPAAIGIGRDGLKQPRLGYIDRIERDTLGAVHIRLTVFARFGTLVQVSDADVDDAQSRHVDHLSCLLVYDDDNGWALLTPPQERFTTGTQVAIRTKRLRMTARLRELRESTPELMLFQLRQSDLSLSPPSYPGARRQQPQRDAPDPRPQHRF